MRSIGVLNAMRKKKRAPGVRVTACAAAVLLALAVTVSVMVFPGPAAAAGTTTMGTQGGGAVIARDPETGDRVMRTPEPQPQQEYQGPQTIIVSPEVYPGGRPSDGNRPPGGERPPRPAKPRPRN